MESRPVSTRSFGRGPLEIIGEDLRDEDETREGEREGDREMWGKKLKVSDNRREIERER